MTTDKDMLAADGAVFLECYKLLGLDISGTDIEAIPAAIEDLKASLGLYHATLRKTEAQFAALYEQNAHAIELIRAVNKTGGVVVELYKGRYLRDRMTEFLNEVDGKVATK